LDRASARAMYLGAGRIWPRNTKKLPLPSLASSGGPKVSSSWTEPSVCRCRSHPDCRAAGGIVPHPFSRAVRDDHFVTSPPVHHPDPLRHPRSPAGPPACRPRRPPQGTRPPGHPAAHKRLQERHPDLRHQTKAQRRNPQRRWPPSRGRNALPDVSTGSPSERKPMPRLSRSSTVSSRCSIDHCCEAWNKLTEQPWCIMSLGLRQWAHRF